ncbi:RNA-binding protein Musashi homolog Rbp6-like isoform X2 [Hydractinia symbiolongicarpus]|uniref:RNA-binding protein Musashi homolog Rbp6-like isoform X2 n=1 Tax=Hydractinia symbiolongicarpus TaxID=13093 RepID=UPI00254DC951|nr:RNA-binding protein Musashi homolog Rbp6-like isoform X2 [Hydractinia symbiolongicarpus]
MAQQVAPVPNGTIPVMSGVQPTIVYQQQPVVMAAPQQTYIPRKPFSRNPQEEQCKIFVGGVGKNTTEESLRAYFGKFGEIADSVIMKDKQTGEPRGFAFVTFKSPEGVQGVVDHCKSGVHTLDGKVVDPKPAVPQGPAQQNRLQALYDAEKTSQVPVSGNQQFKGPMKIAPELKIFVGGIGIGTTEDDVRNYFSTFGPVVQVDMPHHHVYKCPKGFAFVGFETFDSVAAVTKDRYHQINGKTVEVKGTDEQQAHLNKKRLEGYSRGNGRMNGAQVQPGTIATVSGYGTYASPQVIIPQGAAGVPQYAVQMPAAAAGGGYVFDPATNTYYQLPVMAGAGGLALGGAAGVVTSMGANQYAGMTLIGGAGGQQILTSPQVQRPGIVTSDMLAANGALAIGTAYASETSTFGPTRTHLLGAGQQPIAGSADPHVVYSTATSISAGDAAISTPRGYHPYGR